MRKLVAGNWKMNGLKADGLALAREIVARCRADKPPCDVLLCPPATLLAPIADALTDSAVALGGQNCHAATSGAHTGEISAPMLKDAGCAYVILGHSERRTGQGETDAQVCNKAKAAFAAGVTPIICVGETLEQRNAGETLETIEQQIAGSVPPGLNSNSLVIAYEPVWAIGTGLTPTAEQIKEVHGLIRRSIAPIVFDPNEVRILYGGSVKPANARDLMTVPDVDGALVGGASLVAADFWTIVKACA